MRFALLLLAAAALAACDDPDGARRALEAAGMTNIQTEGYSVFGCTDEDTFRTRFSATNPAGKRATGVVCRGWLKGATVRFD